MARRGSRGRAGMPSAPRGGGRARHAPGPRLARGVGCLGPFEHARTEFLYGGSLVDAGLVEEGSHMLAAALDTFEQLGAESWAQRARGGIVAAGGTAPARRVQATERLSAREL